MALKELEFDSASSIRIARFVQEARIAGRLRHPQIVPTFEAGVVDGRYYITSQLITGGTLSELIRRQRPTARQAVQWVRRLADAVSYAHSQGIVHRDIKPANVLIDERNEPQLTDFGLALTRESENRTTIDGTLMGSPAYMSPEQARGDRAAIGPASDQFGLGITLFELLCGRPPFEGHPHVVISRIASEEVPPLSEFLGDVDPDLASIVAKATRHRIVERYATCDEFATDLEHWLHGDATVARPENSLERIRRWYRKNTMFARMVMGLLLLLSCLAGRPGDCASAGPAA